MNSQNSTEALVAEVDFVLHVISYAGESNGALVFLGADPESVVAFLKAFTQTAFPPGQVGGSRLEITSQSPGSLLLEAQSGTRISRILLDGVPASVARIAKHTVLSLGSLVLVFGFRQDGEMILLNPITHHIVKRRVLVDGTSLTGSASHDWKPFLAELSEHFDTIETAA